MRIFYFAGPLFICAVTTFFFTLPVSAQLSDIDQEQRLRQQEQERLLREKFASPTSVQLPRSLKPALRLPASEAPCSIIDVIELQGELQHAFQWATEAANLPDDPATGRCVGAAGLAVIAQRVQNAILEKGYVTTRVLIAPQTIAQHTLTLTLIPGRIRQIRFSEDSDARATLWNAMPAQEGEVLNLRDLEQALENFKRVPSAQADVQILPAAFGVGRPGDSDIVIKWKQGLPLRANIAVDNAGTRLTGKNQTSVTLFYDHWWTLNDQFYLSVNQSAGGTQGDARGHTLYYAIPFDWWLLSTTTSAHRYRQAIAGLNETIDYSGTSEQSDLRLSRILYRDRLRKTTAALRLWTRESANFIGDTEVLVQQRRTSGWELNVAHRELIRDATLDASLTYRRGTGALGAKAAPEEPFGEGSSRMQVINADALLSVPFALSRQQMRYSAGWRAQWNRTPLSPLDRFAIGSRYTVRGFDGELLLVGDRGWLLRQELALALPLNRLELYTGLDVGAVGGRSTELFPGTRLAGAAIGLRGNQSPLYWDVFIAHPIDQPSNFRAGGLNAGFNLSVSF